MHIPSASLSVQARGWLLVAVAALVGGCAEATGAPDGADLLPTPTLTVLGPIGTATTSAPNLPSATLRLSTEPEAFRVGVERAAAGGPAFAVPSLEVGDGVGLFLTVGTLVAIVSGVDAAHLLAETVECERGQTERCAVQFESLISGQNADLGAALGPYARLVSEAATDVQLVTWTPVRNGFPQYPVISLQGIRDGRILGIVVFREIPSAP